MARWAKEGRITPALVTPGGQYRWILDDLRLELRTLRERDGRAR